MGTAGMPASPANPAKPAKPLAPNGDESQRSQRDRQQRQDSRDQHKSRLEQGLQQRDGVGDDRADGFDGGEYQGEADSRRISRSERRGEVRPDKCEGLRQEGDI